MPGDRPHHTKKWHDCVEQVMAKGHDEESASAICTRSLIDAGTDIFEDRPNPDMRFDEATGELCGPAAKGTLETLHILGATKASRTETRDGKEYLVVPVVALMEGVIHPVNASTPEFVPLSTIKRAAPSWNGRPVTLGHPMRGGKQCSANDPDIEATHRIGTIYNSHVEGSKLLQEAWIEKAKARKLHPQMMQRLEANKTEEVSVGTFVVTSSVPGEYNNKRYAASWLDASGDHLAFLPGGRGACSVEMGCGAHRAAMHFVAAESIELMLEHPPIEVFSALQEQSLDERVQAVNQAVYEKCKSCGNTVAPSPEVSAYPIQVFDDRVIVRKGAETFSVPYTMDKAGVVTLGEPTKVKQTWVAAAGKQIECEMCGGTGQIKKDSKQEDCPACDGTGKMMKAAAGARHSMSDMEMIQAVHDHAASLGAKCDRSNYKTLGLRTATIRHEGGKWVLYSQDGSKRLGEHSTKADAEAQEQAIKAAVARRKAS